MCDLEGVGRVQMGTGVVLGLAMVTIVLLLEHTKLVNTITMVLILFILLAHSGRRARQITCIDVRL